MAGFSVPQRAGPGVRLRAGDVLGQVHAVEAGPFRCLLMQSGNIEITRRVVRDHAVRRAFVTDQARQPARIEPGETDHVVGFEPGVQMLRRTIVRRIGNVVADNQAACRRNHALKVFRRRADVADVREGEGDDLAGVGGIGENLLVAGDAGVEADFADVRANRADSASPKHRSIAQNQYGRCSGGFIRLRGAGGVHRRV